MGFYSIVIQFALIINTLYSHYNHLPNQRRQNKQFFTYFLSSARIASPNDAKYAAGSFAAAVFPRNFQRIFATEMVSK
jgi:hypothetical protein